MRWWRFSRHLTSISPSGIFVWTRSWGTTSVPSDRSSSRQEINNPESRSHYAASGDFVRLAAQLSHFRRNQRQHRRAPTGALDHVTALGIPRPQRDGRKVHGARLNAGVGRSEERRVGKEGRCRGWADSYKK